MFDPTLIDDDEAASMFAAFPELIGDVFKSEVGDYDPNQERDEQGRWTDAGGGFNSTAPEKFVDARAASTRSGFMSPLKPADVAGHTLLVSEDGKVGVAVDRDGDVQNLFNNGGPKGAGAHAMIAAIERGGGRTLDCYDGFLPGYYSQFGFREVGRMRFNPAFAKDWDASKYGQPDVVFMAWKGYHPGGARDAYRRATGGMDRVAHERSGQYFSDDQFDAAKRDSRRQAHPRGAGDHQPGREGLRPDVDPSGAGTGSGAGAGDRRLVTDDYDPDQPRDEKGQWAATGIAGLRDVRGPSEDVGEVLDANYLHGRAVGNQTVPISHLKTTISAGDNPERINRLAEKIAAQEGYFSRPIVDDEGNVVEGQHRVAAMQKLGSAVVPIYRVKDLARGMPVDDMEAAIRSVGKIHPDHLNQIVRQVLEMIHEVGTPAKVEEEYEFPREWERQFRAALHAAARGKTSDAFNPDQPRDDQGQWTDTGGSEGWFHGTGVPDLDLAASSKPIYMTRSTSEAGGFAKGLHLGGSGDDPHVYEVRLKPGPILNIDDQLAGAMEADEDLGDTIEAAIKTAMTGKVRYIDFTHPGFSGDDFNARIALYPREDVTVVRKQKVKDASDSVSVNVVDARGAVFGGRCRVADARRRAKPGPRKQGQIERQHQALQAIGEVEVLTAGDEDVCQACQDISDDGPYDIDDALGLIPAHPNCRCAFVPVSDERFAEIERDAA